MQEARAGAQPTIGSKDCQLRVCRQVWVLCACPSCLLCCRAQAPHTLCQAPTADKGTRAGHQGGGLARRELSTPEVPFTDTLGGNWGWPGQHWVASGSGSGLVDAGRQVGAAWSTHQAFLTFPSSPRVQEPPPSMGRSGCVTQERGKPSRVSAAGGSGVHAVIEGFWHHSQGSHAASRSGVNRQGCMR